MGTGVGSGAGGDSGGGMNENLEQDKMMKIEIENRRVKPSLLEGLTVPNLVMLCAEHGVAVPDEAREIDLIHAIIKHRPEFDLVVSSQGGERVPWPKVEVMPGVKLGGAHPKTRSFLRYDNGRLVGLPRYGSNIRGTQTDLKTGETREAMFQVMGGGFIGSMTHSNGDQFAFPAAALFFARLRKGDIRIEQYLRTNHTRQIRGGAEVAGGWVLCTRYTKNRSLFAFHPDTNETKAVHYFPSDEFHGNPALHWHWGIISNGQDAFVLPWGSDFAGFYEGKSGSLELLPERMQGGVQLYGERMLYSHGDYDPKTGKACSIGRHARFVLVFDFATREMEQIPFPEELVKLLSGPGIKFRGNVAACFDQKFGPDGWLYGAPFGTTILIRFHPGRKEIQWKDLAGELAGKVALHEKGKGQGWFTAVHREGNDLIFGAGGGDRFLRLGFNA